MSQSCALPQDIKNDEIDELKSKFQNGVLIVEAPLPKKAEPPKKELEIPIEHKGLPHS